MNAAEKAVVSARAWELVKLTREKVTEAIASPPKEREALVIDALETAVEAIDAMTERLLADNDEVPS